MLLVSLYMLVQCLLAYSDNKHVYKETVNLTTNAGKWFKLGGLFPLSLNENGKCGKIRNSAVEQVEAMVYAIQRINEDHSLLPGVNLTFDIRDTCTMPTRALNESIDFVQPTANKLLGGNPGVAVSGVIGPALNDISFTTASVLSLFKVPQINYGSYTDVLNNQSKYEYFFQTISSDIQQVKVIASLIDYYNWTQVFIVYSNDAYGTVGVNYLIDKLAKTSKIIKLSLGAFENSRNLDLVAEEMSRAWVRDTSVAVLLGHHKEAIGILNAVGRKMTADPDSPLSEVIWIASDSLGLTLDSRFYSKARGIFVVQPANSIIANFADYFTVLTPNTTMNPWFGSYWESVFHCHLTGENRCIIGNQKVPRSFFQPSQISNIVYSVYAFALALDKMLKDFCPNETLCEDVVNQQRNGLAIDGKKLRKYLLNVSLASHPSSEHGNNSTLFDYSGDVLQSYKVYNLQLTTRNRFSFRPIATWDYFNLLSIKEEIIWRNDEVPLSVCSLPCGPGQEPVSVQDQRQCCWICKGYLGELSVSSGNSCHECNIGFLLNANQSSCIAITHTYFTLSHPLGIVVAVLASLGTAVCMLITVAYVIFKNNELIKASSREHVAIMLSGIISCYIFSFIFLVKPSATTCTIQRVCPGICFALIFSALLTKTNRIHRIFYGVQHMDVMTYPPRFITPTSQMILTGLLVLVQVVIAAVWLAIEPPRVRETVVNQMIFELACQHNSHNFLLVTMLYNLLLIIAIAYFAFRTRDVPENFKESKSINIALVSLWLVWLAFLPTFYVSVMEQSSLYQTFVLLLTIILSASVIMLCLIAPRVFLVVWHLFRKSESVNAATSIIPYVSMDDNMD